MKHLILLVLVIGSFSLSAQTVKKVDDKIFLIDEFETETSVKQIDAQIEGLNSSIKNIEEKRDKLIALRKEVESLEKSFSAKSKSKKKK